ncbi:MAG: penicillin-binding protein family [Caulobacteraceae bacterium]|nr:penicillin-binding protein family [Caulobacteraceae bacterium]
MLKSLSREFPMSASAAPADPRSGPQPPAPEKVEVRARRRRAVSQAGIFAIMIVSILTVAIVASLTMGLPLGKSLEPMTSPTLVLVSADGKTFARRGAYKEEPVDAAKLPRHVPMAFVAIEDRRFYQHAGVDPRGVFRALVRNLSSGSIRQGGSTITQQLAKNAFTSGKRTFRRKGREAMIALYLESKLTKDEILSRYISSVYFGDGVFGLRAAARHYFNKTPEQLNYGEAAMLAGVVRSPTRLAPTDHLPEAQARAKVVLAAMADMGVITPAQAEASGRNIRLREGRPDLPIGSYFADWVSPQAKEAFDRGFGEVKVRTTLDSALQAQAEKTLSRVLASSGDRLHATQGALVAMRTDGSVVAMVGGRNYHDSQFNRVTQAMRQPGSSFKPFVYLAALRRGSTPESLVMDAPIKIGDWSPENHESSYSNGPITLRQAFAKSSNVAAVRLEQETGIPAVQRAARDLGITAPLPNDMTLALGSASLPLIQLTSAYAGIAAGAGPVTPYGLVAQPSPRPIHTLGRFERQGLLQLLRAVVTDGTGKGADIGVPAFGKTGTSQDYRDAYFIGFVGDLVIGVWVGNDDNSSMRKVVGGMLPAQVWREVMTYAVNNGRVHVAPLLDTPAPAVQVAAVPATEPSADEAPPTIPEPEVMPEPPPAPRRSAGSLFVPTPAPIRAEPARPATIPESGGRGGAGPDDEG